MELILNENPATSVARVDNVINPPNDFLYLC